MTSQRVQVLLGLNMAPSPALRCCKKTLNWVPALFINLVVGWSYYAYVVELCVYTIKNDAERIMYLVIFHMFLFMFIWTYWKTIWSKPASPCKVFSLPRPEKEQFEREERPEKQQEILKKVVKNLPVYTRTAGGAIKYCDQCQIIKPDRCHHCSTCEKCVLKMDHHCPWVNNCVGFSNYKFFILFLAYAALYCAVICATVVQYFIKIWTSDKKQQPDMHTKFNILFLFFVAALFFISVLCLLSYHLWLVGKNRTTIEALRAPIFINGPDKNGFSLGFRRNVAEVFGDEVKYWMFPVFSSLGDGNSFVTRLVHIDPEQANNVLQQNGKSPVDGETIPPVLGNNAQFPADDDGKDKPDTGQTVTVENEL
ncbi:palmitoyltransferase ZDHHC15B-like [Thalassophryne amazonica]|uniref:palmitoyltransferase ZDHHC15B-like n=1 Tax=Thalassophryne amazonica TaxID=390379 RepID=UPI001471B77D|nr:palmitoyltransferase ZDHHC15B-like [Thalassophryne amazonica]XP_034034369.1 palmitoyltransferase ZDHHC15B-like [Thalassophryne amazonica]